MAGGRGEGVEEEGTGHFPIAIGFAAGKIHFLQSRRMAAVPQQKHL